MEWGSVSDWFSVACNAVMAGVAVYAAKNAKDWLSPKLNERKFRFADELIDQFCKLQQEGFYLHAEVKQLINTDPDEQGDADIFRKRWNAMYQKEIEYRRNIINLRTTMERMDLWGLQPKNEADFKEIIDSHLSLAYKIEDSLSIGADETRFRQQNSFEYDRQISDYYKSVRASHNKIMKHYSKLFID
ncbi:hypothetical protein ACW2AV_000158 [Cronobacter sakazakii]|uniref:hypothetical protein n=1 Tax=Enterobacteriaceae TaxID=543 RepID=UPI0013B052FD|nr:MULTISPECIES: hypothetical protein [Enterobacteriaceae]EIX1498678.1 hypothetical protein [Cronobacter sakazakii]EIX6180245.1 hypothetical protein [Cronobacter sakazakii]EIX6196536.1 hypothetical protein [Cronobacter sakazakii]EIX6203847.1 hypothetical protein [Cronobacter sakazakii]EIX6247153.1 hypothetical protein [Cronobacter sakazakii]